ncbi:MAG: PaaI family thioesterase [Acidobacteriota bacterium]
MTSPNTESTPAPHEPSAVTAEQFQQIVARGMGEAFSSFQMSVDAIHRGFVRLRLAADARHLRPGDTVAGPVLFTLADTALFALVMSIEGPVPLAVTSDLSIRFLRRPPPGDLIGEARLLRRGRRLVVGEVALLSVIAGGDGEGDEESLVAHATGSYAVPSTR